MNTTDIKTILKNYHANKGLLKRWFGDDKDIQRLDKFSLRIQGDNRELSATELHELSSIVLTEDTGIGTDEETVMNELRKKLFGTDNFDYINRRLYHAAIHALQTKPELCSEHHIKKIFNHARPVNAAKAVIALEQNNLLTEENLLLCLKVKKPSQCAEVFQVLSTCILLTSENKERIHAYSNQVDNLKYLIRLFKNIRMPHLVEKMPEYPMLIAPISDFLKKLESISPSLLSIENIRAVIAIATNETHVKNVDRIFDKIYKIFNFHLQKSVCVKFTEHVNFEKLGKRKYKPDHYKMRQVADLRTEENLRKLLYRAKHLISITGSIFLTKYEHETGEFSNQASAQAAFDNMIVLLDRRKRIKISDIDLTIFSKTSSRGMSIPTSPVNVIEQKSSKSISPNRLPR